MAQKSANATQSSIPYWPRSTGASASSNACASSRASSSPVCSAVGSVRSSVLTCQSFRRSRESGNPVSYKQTTLDPRFRGDDASVSKAGHASPAPLWTDASFQRLDRVVIRAPVAEIFRFRVLQHDGAKGIAIHRQDLHALLLEPVDQRLLLLRDFLAGA